MAPDLKFEDLEAHEQRVDIDDPTCADGPVPSPAAENKCREGQDLPGMEIDVMQGNPTDVRSLVCAAPECDSPGVRGCHVDPIATSVSWTLQPEMKSDGCSGNQESEKGDLFVEVDQSQSNDDISMRDLMKMMNQAEAEETRELDREIMSIVKSLGGNSSKYRRERSRAVRAVVSEIYSPPRVSAVAKLCPSDGILPGFALDLTTNDHDGRCWDFDEEEMRKRAWAKIEEEQPMLLIGSPMCTAFSAWQHINNSKRDPNVTSREYQRGLSHLRFCCEFYDYQVAHGRYFLHEHPAQATSWCRK